MDNNINYWKYRYDKMSGQKTVGFGGWSTEQYNKMNAEFNTLFKSIVKETKVENILDFGCGIGRWKEMLKEIGDNYYGTDILEKIDVSTEDRENFEIIKIYSIPFGELKFDFIFSCVTLQHIIDEALLMHYIKQFYNRLSDGGTFFAIENTHNKESNYYLTYREEKEYIRIFEKMGFAVDVKENYSWGIDEKHSIFLCTKEF